jgi:DNA-binding MarR family transcriptional regulator
MRALALASDRLEQSSIHESNRLEDAVAFRIHRANRLLLTHLSRFLEMSDRNLTPEKWFLLARIFQDQPIRQVELTEPTLEDAPNVSRLVESLVAANLVERDVDPADRRSRILSVTAAGRALCEELTERVVIERLRVFDGFTEPDLTALTDALDRLESNIRPSLSDDAGHPAPTV